LQPPPPPRDRATAAEAAMLAISRVCVLFAVLAGQAAKPAIIFRLSFCQSANRSGA